MTDAQFYLKGSKGPFEAVTDHYSLVALTKKDLPDLPVKLRDLFLELRSYNYYTTHIAGARNIISDALCRSVKWAAKVVNGPEDQEDEEEPLDYEATCGIERAYARNATAVDNDLSYVWKDPLMEIRQARMKSTKR